MLWPFAAVAQFELWLRVSIAEAVVGTQCCAPRSDWGPGSATAMVVFVDIDVPGIHRGCRGSEVGRAVMEMLAAAVDSENTTRIMLAGFVAV